MNQGGGTQEGSRDDRWERDSNPEQPPEQHDVATLDEHDLLQMALDEICDFQHQLQQRDGDPESTGDDADDDDDDEDDEDDDDDVVLAGYEHCAHETLRFLLAQERLAQDNPIVSEMAAHLTAQRSTLDCAQVYADYMRSDALRQNSQ